MTELQSDSPGACLKLGSSMITKHRKTVKFKMLDNKAGKQHKETDEHFKNNAMQ